MMNPIPTQHTAGPIALAPEPYLGGLARERQCDVLAAAKRIHQHRANVGQYTYEDGFKYFYDWLGAYDKFYDVAKIYHVDALNGQFRVIDGAGTLEKIGLASDAEMAEAAVLSAQEKYLFYDSSLAEKVTADGQKTMKELLNMIQEDPAKGMLNWQTDSPLHDAPKDDATVKIGNSTYKVHPDGLHSTPPDRSATGLLDAAAKHMRERAVTYDQPEGERSAGAVATAFNAITRRAGERAISESEAWLFLGLLKLVRDRTSPVPHADSLEDATAYFALMGEARFKEVPVATPFNFGDSSECATLLKFYGVKTINELVEAQLRHIEKLQEKLRTPATPGEARWVNPVPAAEDLTMALKRDRMHTLAVEVKQNFGAVTVKSILAKRVNGCTKLPDVPDNFVADIIIDLTNKLNEATS